MKKIFKVFFAITVLSLFTILVVACGGGNKSVTVPEYTGMTIGSTSNSKSGELLLENEKLTGLRSFVMSDIEVPDAENEGEDENVKDEKVEEEVKNSITVNAERTQNEYYAKPNDTIEVHIHINNPDECAILLFRLNGVTYQTYQFKNGSNSTLIIVDYKLDDKSGFRELTIDNLKYVDNTDNLTKDCKMTGADTIKVLVQHTNIPSITISDVEATFNTFSAKAELKDPLNLLQPNSAKLAVYEGETLVKAFDLAVGSNTIALDNLSMGKDYAYYAVGAYDVCDGKGAQAYVFDEGKVSTAEGFNFELTGTTKNNADFKLTKESEAATFEKVVLFDKDNNPIKEVATFAEEVSFDSLSSNTTYRAALYYSFTRSNEKIVRSVPINFDTLASEITISNFEIINDVVKPNEQINVSVEFVNPDNITITSFILNGEEWEVKGGNRTTVAQLYFTAPNKKNETFEVRFEAIGYTFNGKQYIQKVDGDYVGQVQISDVLGLISADFISEYSEPAVIKHGETNLLLVFNNPSEYTISKVYLNTSNEAYTPIQISATEYIVSPGTVWQRLNISKFGYLVGGKEVEITANYDVDINASVASTNVNKITTASQLANIATSFGDNSDWGRGIIYQLQNDIDMAGITWKPFKFFGVLDGNGYTIKNLRIADSSSEPKPFGMFTQIGGMIVNLTIEDFYFNFEYVDSTGGIFCGQESNHAVIQDCYAKNGTIIVKSGSYDYGTTYVGSGTVINTFVSNVEVRLGETLITKTPEVAKPVHEINNNLFETKSNGTFTYKEFDKFVMISSYDSNQTHIVLPATINDKKVVYLNNFFNNSTARITSAEFEEGVESASYVFNGMSSLRSVTLPSTMKKIGNSLFADCNNLSSVTLPDGLESVGERAFANDWNIRSIILPNTLKSIGNGAFSYTGIRTIIVPDSVTYVGQVGLRIQDSGVIIHNHEFEIPAGWDPEFNGWSNLSDKIKVIYNDGKSYVYLNIPADYDNESTVILYEGLTSIDTEPTIQLYNNSSIEGWYLDSNYETKAEFPYTPTENINILYAKIKTRLFIQLYDGNTSVDSIDTYAPYVLENPDYINGTRYAESWYKDVALTEKVEFPYVIDESNNNIRLYAKMEEFETIEENDFVFYINANNEKVVIEYKGDNSIVDMSTMTDVVSVVGAFRNNKTVTNVILPEGIETIGPKAFAGCNNLTEIVLPSTITSIEANAFDNCGQLRKINLPEGLISIGNYAFNCCWNLVQLTLPETLEKVGSGAFESSCLKVLIIPESVKEVEYAAFRINQNGVVVVPFESNKRPSGWSESFAGYSSDMYNPNVIYKDDNKKYTILVTTLNYDQIKYLYDGDINKKPTYSLSEDVIVEGFYYDSDYQDEVTFPYTPEERINYIYLKTKQKTNVVFMNGNSSVKNYYQFVPFIVEKYEMSTGSSYVKDWYYDSSLTQKVSFPLEIIKGGSLYYLYAEWEDYEEVTAGDFKFYLKGDKKVLTAYTGNSSVVDLTTIENLSEIASEVFKETTITDIIIPDGVTRIGDRAFQNCQSLTSITLPNSLTSIGKYAFYNTELREVVIPDNVSEIGEYAFANTSLTSIKLPQSLKHLSTNLISGSRSIRYIELPDGLESVETNALINTNLSIIVVPASVITVETSGLWPGNSNCVIFVGFNNGQKPTGWNSTFNSSWQGENPSTVVYANDTVKYTALVVNHDYSNSEKVVYTGTINTKPSVYLNNATIADWYLDSEYTQKASFPFEPTERVNLLYAKVEKMVEVSFMSSTETDAVVYKTVREYSPYNLQFVDMSKSGKKFDGWYFDRNLTQKVTFPYEINGEKDYINLYPKFSNVDLIKDGYFRYYLNDDNKKVLVKSTSEDAILDLSVITDLVAIDGSAFEDNVDIVKVIIPEGVVSIGEKAFRNTSNLKEVVLPSTLERIGAYAFNNSGITSIVIPNKVLSIEESTFYGCGYLKYLELPDSLISIGASAFTGCYNLNNILLPESLTTIGENALRNISVKMLIIPKNVTSVGSCALGISTEGTVVIPFAENEIPAGWNSNFLSYPGDTYKPKVVYNDLTECVIMLAIPAYYNNNIKIKYENGSINNKPEIEVSGSFRVVDWYLDSALTQKVLFPYIPEENGLYVLYAKVEFCSIIAYSPSEGSWYNTLADGFGEVYVTKNQLESYSNYTWYLDSAHTILLTDEMFVEEENELRLKYKATSSDNILYLYFVEND